MPAQTTRYCVNCGSKHPLEELSRRGLCRRCSQRRILDARKQILAKKGPVYQRYINHMSLGNERKNRRK